MSSSLSGLRIKIFADGADKESMLRWYANPWIRGFTTNPTLMRKAGVRDYEGFAREVLGLIPDRPISFEVIADDFPEMERQALHMAGWAGQVYVKIPVMNPQGEPALALIRRLTDRGVKLNITALLTLEQVREVAQALDGGAPACISVFAGRLADTGRDPVVAMQAALGIVRRHPNLQLIWASPRELWNIFQADQIGCDIITVTSDILNKLELVGKDLNEYSLETVRMFHSDAARSGFTLEPARRL